MTWQEQPDGSWQCGNEESMITHDPRVAACHQPLSLDAVSRKAFADRQAKLVKSDQWPVGHWYNDEDFCRAYNTAVRLNDALRMETVPDLNPLPIPTISGDPDPLFPDPLCPECDGNGFVLLSLEDRTLTNCSRCNPPPAISSDPLPMSIPEREAVALRTILAKARELWKLLNVFFGKDE